MPRKTKKEWQIIRDEICSGENVEEVAKRHGVSTAAIRYQSNEGLWPTPHRIREAGRVAKHQTTPRKASRSQSVPTSELSVPRGTNDVSLSVSMQSLVDSPPELFQEAFGKLMQRAIAEGLPSIPPPRNISELKTYVELWRKCSGLDVKAENGGKAPLVSPMRTVARRREVVDISEEFEI